MLKDQSALRDAIATGVSRGLFAYCAGPPDEVENIIIDEPLPAAQCHISDDAWLLEAAVARALIKPPAPPDDLSLQASDPILVAPTADDAPVTPEAGERAETQPCVRIGIQIELESSDWRQFHTSVIKPLVDKGADTQLSVSLRATNAEGFDRDFIELSIRESVLQVNPAARIKIDAG